MKIKKIKVKTKDKNYSIYVGNNFLNRINKILKIEKIKFEKYLLISDSNLNKKISNNINKSLKNKKGFLVAFKSSEKNKNIDNVNKILEFLLKNNFTRKDCIIAVGGGILGDVASFVASIYKRGISFINIPSTLLAQVDSSIGGKTGINHKKYGKNLIGSFYQPDLVLSDSIFLKTLPKKELICGYAEILKHSLIYDRKNFNFLEKNFNRIIKLQEPFISKAILKSCIIKRNIVQMDEKENNLRKMLNFGHTFGHAYEATTGFNKKINHGEGVLLGIKSAVKFSLIKKYISQNEYKKIIEHIKKIDFNIKLKDIFRIKDINKIIYYMKNDKKNKSSEINLILLKRIGKTILNKSYNDKQLKIFFTNELINI